MDANKLIKLKEVCYKVQRSCGLCVHSNIPYAEHFGTCKKHTYKHQKHSVNERELSIHRNGYCPQFTYDHRFDPELHGFKELFDGRN